MIDTNDLRAAVAAGVLTESQAARLSSLADARRGARKDLAAGDEPFELFKGFNEIFIVVGLCILAMGWIAVGSLLVAANVGQMQNAFDQITRASLVTALLIWLLSEYFVRRRRMIAPAITLTIFWAVTVVAGMTTALSEPFMIVGFTDLSSLPKPMAYATLALLLYWWRFRVPFAMALISLNIFAVAILWTAIRAGIPQNTMDLFLLSGDGPFAWVTLGVGLVVFAAAMWFDMSDPHRVTRRAAQGFWLHVVAAPALVNIAALSLLQQDTATANLTLSAILLLFAVVAIVIDRRSFLIAAVGYCVVLSQTVFEDTGAGYTILALGVTLVLLGASWERLRSILLMCLAPVLPLNRLPPSVGGSL